MRVDVTFVSYSIKDSQNDEKERKKEPESFSWKCNRLIGFNIEWTLILIVDLLNFELFQSFCILLIVSIVFLEF